MTEPGPPHDGEGRDQPSAPDGERSGSSASEPAPNSSGRDDRPGDAAVIDLRTGQPTARSPLPVAHASGSATPSDAPRGARTPPPLPADLPIPTTPPAALAAEVRTPAPVASVDGAARSSTPTRRSTPRASVVRSLLPWLVVPLVVALVGMVAVAVVGTRATAVAHDAVVHARASAAASATARQVDELWSGVLGLVAGGVGQEVADASEVRTLLGATRADAPVGVPGIARDERRAAVDAHERFVDSTADALDRTDADPVELGNELDSLADAHRAAATSAVALADALDRSASGLDEDADVLRAFALLLAILTVLAAALAAVFVRRRLVGDLDRPATRLSSAVADFAAGDAHARAHVTGRGGLAPVARSVDQGLERVAAELTTWRRRAEWGEQSRAIFEALDEAEDEATAHRVIARALSMIDEQHHPVELLLAERGSTRLSVVAADEAVPRPACPVDSTGACPALRRGQVAVFDSSESINTCPHLRDRPGGPRSAVCVPVTVATRPVGVLHVTGPEHQPPRGQLADRLVTLSVQVGNRLGALRTLESTRKEAATDGLTGLPNRRMLESEVASLLERGTPFVMVLADLDKFKKLNDNFGHEIGDKALQLFAGVLRDNVRGNDVVSRLGGEEFVLVYPNMSVEISIEAIGRLRQALARAVAASRLPAFTCSFGITHSDVGGDGDAILRIADAGLLRAKELGGDQAVFADEDLAATIFQQRDEGDAGDDRR